MFAKKWTLEIEQSESGHTSGDDNNARPGRERNSSTVARRNVSDTSIGRGSASARRRKGTSTDETNVAAAASTADTWGATRGRDASEEVEVVASIVAGCTETEAACVQNASHSALVSRALRSHAVRRDCGAAAADMFLMFVDGMGTE